MVDPLPSDVVARLRSDSTAALAAALILAGSFPDLVSWALRAVGGHSPSLDGANGEAKANAAERSARDNGAYASPEAAAKHDEALMALMRANRGVSLTEIIRMNGRPRNSTVVAQASREGRPGRARRPGQVDCCRS
jgi:hypothetical protein